MSRPWRCGAAPRSPLLQRTGKKKKLRPVFTPRCDNSIRRANCRLLHLLISVVALLRPRTAMKAKAADGLSEGWCCVASDEARCTCERGLAAHAVLWPAQPAIWLWRGCHPRNPGKRAPPKRATAAPRPASQVGQVTPVLLLLRFAAELLRAEHITMLRGSAAVKLVLKLQHQGPPTACLGRETDHRVAKRLRLAVPGRGAACCNRNLWLRGASCGATAMPQAEEAQQGGWTSGGNQAPAG